MAYLKNNNFGADLILTNCAKISSKMVIILGLGPSTQDPH